MIRPLLCTAFCALAGAHGARAEEVWPGIYERVEVAPATSSIYVGSVTLTTPAFVRAKGIYEARYTAEVFPYFFLDERGRLQIDAPDELLRKLAQGEIVEFTGRALSDDGVERRVAGTATPADATGGALKVRLFVTNRLELVFNTTYRFTK